MSAVCGRLLLLSVLPALLAGCGWFKEKPPEYVESRELEPLDVPADLDEPRYDNPVVISAPPMRLPSGDELNPGPPRAASTGGRTETNAFIAWSAQGVYLQVLDTPESVARRLGYAIERSGMTLLEPSRAGDYRFEYVQPDLDERSIWDRMAFWRGGSGPDYSGLYRTRLEPDGPATRVYLLFDAGTPATTDAAEHVLGIFMERLG